MDVSLAAHYVATRSYPAPLFSAIFMIGPLRPCRVFCCGMPMAGRALVALFTSRNQPPQLARRSRRAQIQGVAPGSSTFTQEAPLTT